MRVKIHILLGALIAILSGCKTQKLPEIQKNRPMVMYGPPTYFQQQDTTQNDIEQIQNS
jgi:hypothetical protein